MDSLGVLEPLEGASITNLAVLGGVTGQRVINVPADFSTLQAALDSLGSVPAADTKIKIATNTTLTEDIDLSALSGSAASKNSGEGTGLQIVGDERAVVGMSYVSGGHQTQGDFVYDVPAAPTAIVGYSPPFGTRNGLINITAVGNVLTVAIVLGVSVSPDDYVGLAGTIVQPDFTQLGLVAGVDQIALTESNRAISIRTITNVAATSITVDGAAPSMDLNGSAITFLPNVHINSPNLGQSHLVVNGAKAKFKGIHFYAGTNDATRNNVALRDAHVVFNNCVLDERNHISRWNLEAHSSTLSGTDRGIAVVPLVPALTGMSTNMFNDELPWGSHSPNTLLGGGNVGSAFVDGGWNLDDSQLKGGSWWVIANTQGQTYGANGFSNGSVPCRIGAYMIQYSGWYFGHRHIAGTCELRFGASAFKCKSFGFGMAYGTVDFAFPQSVFTCDAGVTNRYGIISNKDSKFFFGINGAFAGGQKFDGWTVACMTQNGSNLDFGNNNTLTVTNTTRMHEARWNSHIRYGQSTTITGAFASPDIATDVCTISPQANAAGDNVFVVANPAVTRMDSAYTEQALNTGVATAFTIDPTEQYLGNYVYVGRTYRMYSQGTPKAYTLTVGGGAKFIGSGAVKTVATWAGINAGEGITIRVTSSSEVQIVASTAVVFT